MRIIRFIFVWLLVLVVGASLATLLDSVIYHRYDDNGVGEYYGVVHGTFQCDRPSAFLEFEAESAKSFRWWPPDTYIYDSLNLKIATESGELSGKLNAAHMTFDAGDKEIRLTEPLFARLLLGDETIGYDDAHTISRLFSLLQSAGAGQFPHPRHHTYQIPFYDSEAEFDHESVVGGRFVHFSCGKRASHLVVYWAIAWMIGLTCHVLRDRITNRGPVAGDPSHTT